MDSKDYYEFPCGCKFEIIGDKPFPKSKYPMLNYDLDEIPLDCKGTYDLIATGKTKMVFQIEKGGGRQGSKELRPESIEHLAGLSSALRPGAANSLDENGVSTTKHYYMRKNGEEPVTSYHSALDPILGDTFNCMLFQEQCMKIAVEIAGFNEQEADGLRKCLSGNTNFISKKYGLISIDNLLKTDYENDEFLTAQRYHNPFANFSDLCSTDCYSNIWKKINSIWSNGQKEVFEVKTKDGLKIEITEFHLFLTNNGWKSLSTFQSEKDALVTYSTEGHTIDQIVSCDSLGFKEVFDFTMSDQSEPYIVANGFIVHNSIGKKLAEEMAKVEKWFIDGAKKEGIVSEAQAKEIFGWIKESARYSFNLSVVPETTCVKSDGSITTIADLKIGDKINSPGGLVEVKDKFDHGIQEVYRITLESGKTIDCTMEHKFLCQDRLVRKLSDILLYKHKIVCEENNE